MSVDVSVVIPAYRSAGTVPTLVDRLLRALASTGLSHELIFVDDGSPDRTWEALRAARAAHPDRITLIQLMNNFGQHNALMCGFRHARGEFVVTVDDDLQHPPEEIPKLLEKIQSADYDVVYGSYFLKRQSMPRQIVSLPFYIYYRLVFRARFAPSPFRIMRRRTVLRLAEHTSPFVVIDGLLGWCTNSIGRVFVEHVPRAKGRSTHSLLKLIALGMNVFTSVSVIPLRTLSLVGLGALALGMGASVVSTGQGILAPALFFMGGVQLLGMGLLGEYVGRAYLTLSKKPQYIERHILPAGLPDPPMPPRPKPFT